LPAEELERFPERHRGASTVIGQRSTVIESMTR
jgi:hypothetical protein